MKIDKTELRKEGVVLTCLSGISFKIQLTETEDEVIGYLSGKLRANKIKILPGDIVTVELSQYDKTRGRIVYRGKMT